MKGALLRFARRIGVPGLFVWLFMVGVYLWVRVPDGSWRAWDVVKYTVMPLGVSYVFGAMRAEEKKKPYILCTSCAKKNREPPGMVDPVGWTCGYCGKTTLVRVGTELPA